MPAPILRAGAPLLALALVLTLAACGGAGAAEPDPSTTPAAEPTAAATDAPATDAPVDAPAPPGPALDACAIVTAADVQAATGASDVEPGELKATPTSLSPGRTRCTYQGDWGRLIVELTPEDGVNLYDAARGSYKDASDITGIGDGAFNSNGENRAFVVKGPVAVMLTIFVGGKEQLDVATSLATAVVAKL